MNKHDKQPKKKLCEKPEEPGRKFEPGNERERGKPAAAEHTGETTADRPDQDQPSSRSENPSAEEVISTWSAPVTNQDEQEKITNAEGDLPIPNQ
ncbi:MAG: hypothetical protein WD824_05285 [Cyclobacteriaceae bacterium]